jgi:hypothetical protein
MASDWRSTTIFRTWHSFDLIYKKNLLKTSVEDQDPDVLCLLDPVPLVRGTDPDSLIISINSKKNLYSYYFMTFYLRKIMYLYLQKVISRKTRKKIVFVGVLKVNDENSRIRIHWSEARIRGSGSVPKCHGSTTLLKTYLKTSKNSKLTDTQNCL